MTVPQPDRSLAALEFYSAVAPRAESHTHFMFSTALTRAVSLLADRDLAVANPA